MKKCEVSVMLIDFHTHAFPDKIADRALSSLSPRVNMKPLTDGTVSDLIAKMDEWHVDRAVVCNIATNPKQTVNVNHFAMETNANYGDRLTALGSVNPGFEDISGEMKRIADAGIPGIKIHPEYMGHTPDDPVFDEIFEAAAELDLFVITHAGFDALSPSRVYANPDATLRRIRRSPKTKFVCAHWGANMMWHETYDKLLSENVWIDTSLCAFSALDKNFAVKMIDKIGADRVLFASDCPWASSAETFAYLDSLPLRDDVKEKIYYANAEKLLKIRAQSKASV